MKKLQLIINIVLGAAVIALFILHFFNNLKKTSVEDSINVTTQISPDSASIAYINYDSLLLAYDYYYELSNTLEKRKSEMEMEIKSQFEKYERRRNDYIEKAQKGLLLRSEMQQTESDLAYEEQRLLNYKSELEAKLFDEEQVLNNKLYNKIIEYIEDYNKNKGYQYIIRNNYGGALLYSEKSLNITDDIIKGLNTKYKDELDAKEKK